MHGKLISVLTLCDLSKAFDSVSHTIFFKKLLKVGVDNYKFDSYLSERTQSVRPNNTISSKQPIEYGVPQGLIFGPVLFNIFVNDLSTYINDRTLVQYADDTQFLHCGPVHELDLLLNKTETTLRRIKSYFLKHGLLMNANKTQYIIIGTRQLLPQTPNNITINLHDSIIQPVTHVKSLGVHIDRYITFEKHINEINGKVMGSLTFLNRVKDCFDRDTRNVIVQSLVLSILNYCNTIWGTATSTHLNDIQKLQNFAAKVVDGKRK